MHLSDMIHTLLENQRVWAVAPARIQAGQWQSQQTSSPDSRPEADASSAPYEEGWGAEWLSFHPLDPGSTYWVMQEETTDETWAHGCHSPSTLWKRTRDQYNLEEKCQDVQCAVFHFYTGNWPSTVRLLSQHIALSFLSPFCSSRCKVATMGSNGTYLPITEESGHEMFPVLKQNLNNHSFLKVCPANMHFCDWA